MGFRAAILGLGFCLALPALLAAAEPPSASVQPGKLGIRVQYKGGHLQIVSVEPGSPAEEADILAGDEIVGVEGVSPNSLDHAMALLKGPVGSRVRVQIIQPDGTGRNIQLERRIQRRNSDLGTFMLVMPVPAKPVALIGPEDPDRRKPASRGPVRLDGTVYLDDVPLEGAEIALVVNRGFDEMFNTEFVRTGTDGRYSVGVATGYSTVWGYWIREDETVRGKVSVVDPTSLEGRGYHGEGPIEIPPYHIATPIELVAPIKRVMLSDPDIELSWKPFDPAAYYKVLISTKNPEWARPSDWSVHRVETPNFCCFDAGAGYAGAGKHRFLWWKVEAYSADDRAVSRSEAPAVFVYKRGKMVEASARRRRPPPPLSRPDVVHAPVVRRVGTDRPAAVIKGGPGDRVIKADFSPDAQRLLTVSLDRALCVWDLRTRSVECDDQAYVFDAQFLADGRRVVAASGERVVVFDLTTRNREIYEPGAAPVYTVSVSPTGDRVLAAGNRLEGGSSCPITSWDLKDPYAKPTQGGSHNHVVECVQETPDAKQVMAVSLDGDVRFWEPKRWQTVQRFSLPFEERPERCAISPRGDWALVQTAKGLRVYTRPPGGLWRPHRVPTMADKLVAAARFSTNDDSLYTLTRQGSLRFGPPTGLQPKWEANLGVKAPTGLAVSRDGSRFAVLSSDRPPEVWDAKAMRKEFVLGGER